jgi:hypothetical protein
VLFRRLALLTATASMMSSASAIAATPAVEATPYPGVGYARYDLMSPTARIHVVSVDLSSSELELVATREADKGSTVSQFATASETQIVVNGNFFDPDGFAPVGLARGGGQTWGQSADDGQSGVAWFFKGPTRTELSLSPPEAVLASLDAQVQGAVSGRPMLVRAGAPMTAPNCTDLVTLACLPAPRTALGRSADGNTMWLVVVDGWQPGSVGLTAVELAGFVADLGADQAIMLDGGSASTMYVAARGGLVSSPSDGVERPVANHLAVRFGALDPGYLRGVVKEKNLDGDPIVGAVVTLDDGQSVTYDGDGDWQFEVAPRYACATATADGYQPNTTCRQVESQETVFGSIFLFPEGEVPDAGPLPDAGPAADASLGDPADAAAGDAGMDGKIMSGCAASASGAGASGALASGLFVLTLSMSVRRRKESV